MASLYVAEYNGTNEGSPNTPPIAEQVVTYTGTAAASTAFNARTTLIRVHTDAICSIAFGKAPVAVVTNARLVAGQTEYFAVGAGDKISAITNS